MPRLVPVPESLANVPFDSAAASRHGLSPTRLRGADLNHPFHGVHRVATERDVLSLARAYAVIMGAAAFFCGLTAAELLGLPLPPGRRSEKLHVAVPSPSRAPRGEGIAGHKFVVAPGEVISSLGLAVTSPARTWCDLAVWLELPHLVAVADHLVRTRMADLRDLVEMAHRHPGRRGRGTRLRAIELIDGRSESPPESVLRVLLHLAGLRGFVPNVEVLVGAWHYRLDLAWPELRIALEYQGGYHHDEEQWKRDMTRRTRLESAGWTVLFVNSQDLTDPAEFIRTIRRVIASRAR